MFSALVVLLISIFFTIIHAAPFCHTDEQNPVCHFPMTAIATADILNMSEFGSHPLFPEPDRQVTFGISQTQSVGVSESILCRTEKRRNTHIP